VTVSVVDCVRMESTCDGTDIVDDPSPPSSFLLFKETKLEEIEVSHTLGGSGEGRVQGRGKWTGCRCYSGVRHAQILWSCRFSQSLGFVTITNGPVFMCERGS
jgi:hypothetical protein